MECIASSGSKLTPISEKRLRVKKQIKGWNRAWKIRMIERINPEWKDLYFTLQTPEQNRGFPSPSDANASLGRE
jgi:hypothetical protein